MSPSDRQRRAEAWAEGRETSLPDYEPTYRDGTVRHECWNPGGYSAPPRSSYDRQKKQKDLEHDAEYRTEEDC